MKKLYILRVYPENLLENSGIKALKSNRKNLTVKENKTDNPNHPLILTHHPSNKQISNIIRKKLGYTKVLI